MKKLHVFFVVAFAILGACNTHAAPLRTIMQDLGQAVQRMNQGILAADNKMIKAAALAIANHAAIDAGDKRILKKTLGSEMKRFKAYDGAVHQSAMSVVKAIATKRLGKVIDVQAQMLKSCVACHDEFKARVVKAFAKTAKKP